MKKFALFLWYSHQNHLDPMVLRTRCTFGDAA